MHAYLLI